jgi:hypothetical protein
MADPADPDETRRRDLARVLERVEALVRELEPEKAGERPAAEIGEIAVTLAGGEATWRIDYRPPPRPAGKRKSR